MNCLTPYPITPIGNFMGFVLALIPLVSQIRKLSAAVWGYAIWIAIYCFIEFVNTIIWHDNVNIVAPVWCDIGIKLQLGASVGTRVCAFVICVHLYKVTRLRGSIETTASQRRKTLIYELLAIIGIPFLVMALFIIIQPIRFQILEEAGCELYDYSFVGYIIIYGPELLPSLGCVVLAPLILRTFMRHRKEMNEYLSSDREFVHNKYHRLMLIACLDTLVNLPVLIIDIVTNIVAGEDNSLNYPYVSWESVHNGAGGNLPGLSLSSILQLPASEWNTGGWNVFNVKWNEWLFVFHALVFFSVFGTTPEMRHYYRSVFWFIPERCGYERRRPTQEETVSDFAFTSNPVHVSGILRSGETGSIPDSQSLTEQSIGSARYESRSDEKIGSSV
ncbi:STE3-domain-containing protein [Schizopora paradoxa]|uniref:STE3-domain-containing protein n=1 Tax=Schizopora paradoxa TaxID=27342 RepID=A0A0H2RMF4_9AGAM|nr:STE3-domain-containing protein [Schizopora paradoxa]